jgi:hypothetical protein
VHKAVGGLGGVPAVPTPSGWEEGRFARRVLLSLGYIGLLDAGAATVAVWAFADGDAVLGVLFGTGAVYITHALGFFWCVLRGLSRRNLQPTLVATPDGDGIQFRYGLWQYYWFAALLIMTEALLLGVVAIAIASATPPGWLLAAVLTAVAVAIGWFIVAMLLLAPGAVIASPAGVTHRSLTFTNFAPWDSVLQVDADWMNTPNIMVRAIASPRTRLHRRTGRFGTAELRYLPTMLVRTYWLATDPAVVYHALVFYHAHPELRPELATQAGLDRISSGRARDTAGG